MRRDSLNTNISWVLVSHRPFCGPALLSLRVYTAYAIVGEEKHTGMQDPSRGASRVRLSAGIKEWLHRWGYPWNERDGVICIDALTHS